MRTITYIPDDKWRQPGEFATIESFTQMIRETLEKRDAVKAVLEPGDMTHYEFFFVPVAEGEVLVCRAGFKTWCIEYQPDCCYSTNHVMGAIGGTHPNDTWLCAVVAQLLNDVGQCKTETKFFDWKAVTPV